MGLVAFGLIFIGADPALLTDADYQSLQKLADCGTTSGRIGRARVRRDGELRR